MQEIENRVVVTDIQMNFSSMIVFMVKWGFAAIPAMMIVSFFVGALILTVTLILAALGMGLGNLK